MGEDQGLVLGELGISRHTWLRPGRAWTWAVWRNSRTFSKPKWGVVLVGKEIDAMAFPRPVGEHPGHEKMDQAPAPEFRVT